jgi:hypothetical protein
MTDRDKSMRAGGAVKIPTLPKLSAPLIHQPSAGHTTLAFQALNRRRVWRT